MAAKLPAGIELLPSGRFRWRVRAGGGRRITGTTDSLAEARTAMQSARIHARDDAMAKGAQAPRPEQITVADLLAHWIAEVDHAASTTLRRDIALAAIPRVFLGRRAQEVTPPLVAALWREMAIDGTGPHTIDKARNALSAAWQLGVSYGIVASNPIRPAKVKLPKTKRITPPDPEQVRRILAVVEHRPALSAALNVMATIGTRPGEVCAFTWDRLDLKRRIVTVGPSIDTKGNVTDGKNDLTGWRDVEIPAEVLPLLRRVERVVGVPWVFQRNHEPWRPQSLAQEFERARDRAGLSGIRLYDLRHFAATQAIAAGVPIPDVAEMLGDNPATVMKNYAHKTTGAGSAAAAVSRRLHGTGG